MSEPVVTAPAGLLLDEMSSPVIAAALRDLGHDVSCVAEQPSLRAMTDEDVFAFAVTRGCWLLTENVKDFQPILQQALQAGLPAAACCSPAAARSPGRARTRVR
jgi:hypothetical protein